MTARRLLLPLLACVAGALLGCQTLRSWQHGCPGVYSGVKFYADWIDWLPADGKVVFTLDLPFSAIADTLSLPVTFFASPERPVQGFVRGCKWAGG